MEHQRGPYLSSHMLVVLSYTMLVIGLVAETILMDWEFWAIPLIIGGVVICWIVHIRRRMTAHQRLWVYTTLMMATFFFYGIHVTSMYDMSLLMLIVLLVFTTTGEGELVTFCQITYFVTLAFDLTAMIRMGTEWDSLLISRTCLHIALMIMAGWLARFIIRLWAQLFQGSSEQIADLDRATQRMNAFMANLSHELRTPVNAILGTMSTLVVPEKDPERLAQMNTVRDAGRRMAVQVSDILDFSELETGRLVVNTENYELSSLLNDLVEELRSGIRPGVELVIDVEADIPAGMVSDVGKLRRILFHLIGNSLNYTAAGGVYVHVTAVRQSYGLNLCFEIRDTGVGMTREELEQIGRRFYQAESGRALRTGGLGLGVPIAAGFIGALGGFLQFESSPGEGTTVRISVPQKISDERPCMSVADPGRIVLGSWLNMQKYDDPRVREFYNSMIFDLVHGLGTPLHRVDKVEDLRRLLGRVRLTHLFVGEEEYRSAPELMEELAESMSVVVVAGRRFQRPERSRVTVMPKPFYCFPVISVLNADPDSRGEEDGQLRCDGVRALVVDDEPMNLSVASAILRRYGMTVRTVLSGAEALSLCAQEDVDIIFMDHMMPGMDGVEAMKRLRQEPRVSRRDVPIVALTANALSTAREYFLSEGFDAFISKPIELPELERTLRRMLPCRLLRTAAAEQAPAEALAPVEEAPSEQGGALIDRATGLGYCQGDEELYASLLAQFRQEAPAKREQLETFYRQGDCKNYAIYVHGLKSTSKTIGALDLSEKARELELAAKAGELDFLRAHHADLLEAYGAVLAALGEDRAEDAPEEEEVLNFLPEEETGDPEKPEEEEVLNFFPEGEE